MLANRLIDLLRNDRSEGLGIFKEAGVHRSLVANRVAKGLLVAEFHVLGEDALELVH